MVADACEMFGAAYRFGIDFDPETMDDAAWQAAGSDGYQLISEGPAGIQRFTDHLLGDFLGRSEPWSDHGIFGVPFQAWLVDKASHPAYDWLKDVIRRRVIEKAPFGPKDRILGYPARPRQIHSLASLAYETGVPLEFARVKLREVGIIDAHQFRLRPDRILVANDTDYLAVLRSQSPH